MKKNQFKSSLDGIRLLKQVFTILSPSELECFLNFSNSHDPDTENLAKLFQDEFPEIYHKINGVFVMKNNRVTLRDLKLFYNLQACFSPEEIRTLYNYFVCHDDDGSSTDYTYNLLSKDFPDLYNKLNSYRFIL